MESTYHLGSLSLNVN